MLSGMPNADLTEIQPACSRPAVVDCRGAPAAKVVGELKQLGAEVVLVDGPDLAQRIAAASSAAVRLAIDAVGGEEIVRGGDALADEATIVNYGRLSDENPQLSPHQCVFKRLFLIDFWLTPRLRTMAREEIASLYAGLTARIADGSLRVPVQATFAIEDIKQAVALAQRLPPRQQTRPTSACS